MAAGRSGETSKERVFDFNGWPYPVSEMEFEQALHCLDPLTQVVVACGLGEMAFRLVVRVRPMQGRVLVIERGQTMQVRVRRQLIQSGLDELCRVYASETDGGMMSHWRHRTEHWINGVPISHVFLGDEAAVLAQAQLLREILPAQALVPGRTKIVRVVPAGRDVGAVVLRASRKRRFDHGNGVFGFWDLFN